MLFFSRKWLRDHDKVVPASNSDELRAGISAVMDDLENARTSQSGEA
jgi:hypothetical protein